MMPTASGKATLTKKVRKKASFGCLLSLELHFLRLYFFGLAILFLVQPCTSFFGFQKHPQSPLMVQSQPRVLFLGSRRTLKYFFSEPRFTFASLAFQERRHLCAFSSSRSHQYYVKRFACHASKFKMSTLSSAASSTDGESGNHNKSESTFYEIANNFSLEELHKRLQEFVDHPNHPGIVLAVAGGGGHLLSSLSSTPGASQVLLQACILYDRESYRRYIQQATNVSLELNPSFRYASTEASRYAASASLKEALEISAAANTTYGHEALHNIRRAIGVGIASALKSPHSKSKTSRAFVTAETSTGQMWSLSAQLAKSERTRVQEDIAVAHIALTLLQCVQSNASPIPLGERRSTKAGDTWEINRLQPDHQDAVEITRESIRQGVERILDQGDESVMLLPFQTPSGVAFRCIQRTVLPPHSIVFPGSFNPVHEGHVELAKASMEKTHSKMAFFEISITNADKPALSLDVVVERMQKFLNIPLLHEEENASILSHCRWGVLLTNAPLFKQKVDILQPLHVSRTDNKPKPLPFVIGTDTLVRLVDPKYYNNSYEQMVAALEGMACDFVVGGRLEQKKTDQGSKPVFVSGEAEIEKLPDSIRPKFTALEDFRVDISSSEIRRQKSAEQE